MPAQEQHPEVVDELARKRAEHAAEPPEDELQLRERVRQEARRTQRRQAAADRARRRAGSPLPPPDPSGSGGSTGAA